METHKAVNFFTPADDDNSDSTQLSIHESILLSDPDMYAAKFRSHQQNMLDRANATLKSVDSEVFDVSPFQPGTTGPCHNVSSPFENPHYPIEIIEGKKQLQREICTRARLESTNLHSPMSPKSSDVAGSPFPSRGNGSPTPPQNVHSPQIGSLISEIENLNTETTRHVEMHTFRDAQDINYTRMAITGEELSGIVLEDTQEAAKQLIEALNLRNEYMDRIGNFFPTTTKSFISGHYPEHLPKCRKKNTEQINNDNAPCQNRLLQRRDSSAVSLAKMALLYGVSNTSFHPPEPPVDHWGLNDPLPVPSTKYILKREDGLTKIYNADGSKCEEYQKTYLSRIKFLKDSEKLVWMIADGPLKSFCFRRLSYLQNKFQLHVLLNELRELHEQKSVPHRDFYNIRKVDTHIHAASSMNQKHLLRFIKKKLKTEKDVVVLEKDGKKITMAEVFKSLGIEPYDLSVDMLDVHADRNTFHRFDKFNTKYNPVGESTLREIFIKTDNYVKGKYFAEVLKEVFTDLEDSKYQNIEPRISIYGRSKSEWTVLANWAISHDVWSTNSRFLIQIPRLYDIYKEKNMIKNFEQLLDNIFTPLFEVTNDPSVNPNLHRFLQQVSGIDSVDDESKHEYVQFDKSTPCPANYTDAENPPYNYYLYYMYANICVLNALRRERGFNTFSLRPHCGEAGHVNHLLTGYLTSESISHGLLLRKVPVLQYLFYLTQMGIAMSPLSNNSLFIPYNRNPLPEYLMKGLNVSISSDDPLQFHYTREPLVEEYSIAAQVWKLSSCDMCELARYSVLQSGFEDKLKIHWLGPNFKEEGVFGNDVTRTNVPDIRVSFRHEALVDELTNIFEAIKKIKNNC